MNTYIEDKKQTKEGIGKRTDHTSHSILASSLAVSTLNSESILKAKLEGTAALLQLSIPNLQAAELYRMAFPAQLNVLSEVISSSIGSLANLNKIMNSFSLPMDIYRSLALEVADFLKVRDDAIKSVASSYLDSFRTINEQVLQLMAGTVSFIEAYGIPSHLTNALMQMPKSYMEFTKGQLKYASAKPDVCAHALEVTNIGGKIANACQTTSELFLANAQFAEEDESSLILIKPNVFTQLNRHASSYYREKSHPGELDNLLPYEIVSYACSIVRSIYKINEWFLRSKSGKAFSLTNKSLLAVQTISLAIADNEDRFAQIIDALYFLLYEGTGNSARLDQLCSSEVSLPIQTVKRIRNSCRHDQEHGDSSKTIRKTTREFERLIGKPCPMKPMDYKNAQKRIYAEIDEMLKTIISTIDPD